MEARDYNFYESDLIQLHETEPPQEQLLSQQYQAYNVENQKRKAQARKSQRRELSFFLHVASYSILFALLYPIFQAIIPFFFAFPLALLLPIGLILGTKSLTKKYLLKK